MASSTGQKRGRDQLTGEQAILEGNGFLGRYLASLKELPPGVRQRMRQIRQLDEEAQLLKLEVANAEKELYSRIASIASSGQGGGSQVEDLLKARAGPASEVRVKRQRMADLQDQKVSLSTGAYELIDGYMKQLDSDIQRLESEVKNRGEPGQTSKMIAKKAEALKAGVAESEDETETPEKVPEEIPIDPNEPVYCYCQRVSFGEMVGCDNDDCRYEWFHFACVNITKQPEGEWLCPDCRPKAARIEQD